MDESKQKKNQNIDNNISIEKNDQSFQMDEAEHLINLDDASFIIEGEVVDVRDTVKNANKRKSAKQKLLLESIPVNMPESYIDNAGFATTFNSQLGSFKRTVRSELSISRLFHKAENATKLKEDTREYKNTRKAVLRTVKTYARKKLRESANDKKLALSDRQNKDLELLMNFVKTGSKTSDKELIKKYVENPKTAFKACIKDFMDIDISTLNLTSDKDFVKATKTINSLADKVEAMKAIIRNNNDLVAEQGPEFLEKVDHIERLIGYCHARKNLLLNNYYITHYNDEISYLENREAIEIPEDAFADEETTELKNRRKVVQHENKLIEVSNLIYAVEMSSYFFRHGYNPDSEEGKNEFRELYSRKLSEKQKLATMDSFVHHSKTAESPGSSCFGAVLQFFNWIARDKRRTDFGEPMYEESVRKLEQLPDEIKNHNFDAELLKRHGNGPDLDLKQYVYDDVKDALRNLIAHAPAPGNDPDYKLALEALTHWTSICGIVNQDITRMEMAFSDTFLKASKRWLSAHKEYANSKDPYLKDKYNILKNANTTISTNLYGGLSRTLGEEELNRLKTLPILRENNTYLKNVQESNVKDIPLFLHDPIINDVKQSTVGDCWLLSGIQTLLATNPFAVKEMFHDLGDGSVIVRLYQLRDSITGEASTDYDAAEKDRSRFKLYPVFVRLSKDYEESDGYANDCLWVQLVERAVAALGLNAQHSVKIENNMVSNTATEITNGVPEGAMSILTGKLWSSSAKPSDIEFNDSTPLQDYHYILAGIPYRVKEAVVLKIAEAKQDQDVMIDEETLLTYVREEQQKYKTSCTDLVNSFTEIKASLADYIQKESLTDMPNLDTLEEDIKEAVWFQDIDKSFEATVKANLRNLENGRAPMLTALDNRKLRNTVHDFRESIKRLKTAIEQKDRIGVQLISRTLASDTDFAKKLVTVKGAALEKELKVTKDDVLSGNYKTEEDLQHLNRHIAMRAKYDLTGYTTDQTETLIRLLDAFNRNDKAVPVALGTHCMTVLDIKYITGQWYVLIRDPFNIYNKKYTKKNGTLTASSEGFGSVFRLDYYNRKRHLTDRGGEANFRAGFRGMSWWNFKDLFKELDYINQKV